MRENISMAVFPRFFISQTSSLMPRDKSIWSAHDPAVQEAWTTCGAPLNWGSYFVLAMIPFAVRLLQSLRRYKDSKLPTHLINVSLHYRVVALKQLTSWLNVQAGKYGMGIVYYFCYYLWRRDGRLLLASPFLSDLLQENLTMVLLSFSGVSRELSIHYMGVHG